MKRREPRQTKEQLLRLAYLRAESALLRAHEIHTKAYNDWRDALPDGAELLCTTAALAAEVKRRACRADTGPKTVEAARNLPEVSGALRLTDKPTRLGQGITGDSLYWFIDADGRSMRVIATDNGFAKTEL